MIMVGTPVVLVSRNTTRAVLKRICRAKELLAMVSIQSVVKNVPDIIIQRVIFLPDMSKTEAVKAVPALNIRLNAIPIHQIPELMLIAVLLPEEE